MTILLMMATFLIYENMYRNCYITTHLCNFVAMMAYTFRIKKAVNGHRHLTTKKYIFSISYIED